MKFKKRKLIIEIEKRTIDKKTGHISFQFQIGPFKKTMGTTIGGALRRTLLSLSKSVTITSACGKFHNGNCLREDLFELSLNLQKINIKSSFFPYIGTGRIKKFGPAIITAQDIELEDGLQVVNPYQYICTINEGYDLDMLVMIASPTLNQTLYHGNPSAAFVRSWQEGLENREENISPIIMEKRKNFFKNLENLVENSTRLESLKKMMARHRYYQLLCAKSKKQEPSLADIISFYKKSNSPNIGGPQKLPFDLIMVDPIYSAIQSCGFEISQTIKSSVTEYDELIKRGIVQTEEFLKFVVISRGTVEPVLAIQAAVNELKDTLSVIHLLEHAFVSQKNVFLALQNLPKKTQSFKTRQHLIRSYTYQILSKLDISHLNLPLKLELILRRHGFVNLENLISIPLEFLKRIGLQTNEIKVIQKSLSKLGVSSKLEEELVWDLIPPKTRVKLL